jgi:fatty acid desaturase
MNNNISQQIIKRHRFSLKINKELNDLIKLDNWHGIIALAYDYLIIFLAIKIYFINIYFYPVSLLLIGSRQGALSNLLHESAHCRLTRNKMLNYVLGTYLSGYLIFQEYYAFVDSHIKAHHHYLGNKEKDPDYYFHLDSGLYKATARSEFIKKYILKPLFLGNIYDYTKHIFLHRAPTFGKYQKNTIKMGAYLLTIILLICYLGWFKYFILFWLVPFFTVFPIIGWFIDLVEHYPLVGENNIDLYMTRNRFGNFIEDFIFNLHNENYHLVHHLRPAIPFWNLKKAHHIMLKDPEYKNANQECGGIFYSPNQEKTFLRKILERNREIFVSQKI